MTILRKLKTRLNLRLKSTEIEQEQVQEQELDFDTDLQQQQRQLQLHQQEHEHEQQEHYQQQQHQRLHQKQRKQIISNKLHRRSTSQSDLIFKRSKSKSNSHSRTSSITFPDGSIPEEYGLPPIFKVQDLNNLQRFELIRYLDAFNVSYEGRSEEEMRGLLKEFFAVR
ncbi:hypothetical protein PVL30_002918 [Lodderomyces elongisporus]|uniref:uncharacterized protein n=1 Tax=Lodderomyces elongisporus TaxID=36914 RepID=UPI002925F755|nr:uncharacterized protein PVL30_002918 [Lodderomyces elongisporus]WLF79167.1 hypothetical protein PVL30_002918 [Lodderomyces elongisporus]